MENFIYNYVATAQLKRVQGNKYINQHFDDLSYVL